MGDSASEGRSCVGVWSLAAGCWSSVGGVLVQYFEVELDGFALAEAAGKTRLGDDITAGFTGFEDDWADGSEAVHGATLYSVIVLHNPGNREQSLD